MAQIVLIIQNSRTEVARADDFFLYILDLELRYPTDMANLGEQVELPEGSSAWDGWVRLFHRPLTKFPWFPTGLLPLVLRLAKKFKREVEVKDTRQRPEEGFPELVSIDLRDYQREAVNAAVRAGRGVLDLPPRAGKTRAMVEIMRRIALPTIWTAPTDRIVTQTAEVIESLMGKNFCYQLAGSRGWEAAAQYCCVVTTAATAVRLPREFYQTRQMIAVDEWHHSAAATYREIFSRCDHIYFRFGMTGTFFRSGQDAMAMHALLSATIYKVTSLDLLKRGYLVPIRAVFVPVATPKLRGLGTTDFQAGHGRHGIHENQARNDLVAHCALATWQAGYKPIVLVGTKRQGRLLQDAISFWLPKTGRTEFRPVEFLSSDCERDRQGRIIESFERGAEVKILLGTSLLGEGVDLPSASALIYARGEQAEVTQTQGMYRIGTAVPGKTHAVLIDFADRHHKKLLQHAQSRLRVYYAEPTFTVEVLDDAKNFDAWLISGNKNRGAAL
jgi:superfamily II DNA or RNA helicase